MHVLVIGGAGYVSGLVLPRLAEQHRLRVFDQRPPANQGYEYVIGNLDDYDTLSRAAEGIDALLFMAMGSKQFDTTLGITSNFDVSVKGLYLALLAAQQAGAMHAVYTSSMSVYDGNLMQRTFPTEDLPPDSNHFYGLTKRLGEEVCRSAVNGWGMSVNALRLCFPIADDAWLKQAAQETPTLATAASDLTRALLAALEYRDGFQAFTISGDYKNSIMNMEKARRLLNWAPLARPQGKEPGDAPPV